MLNKLLKRCMPWMDKGRWYKLTLEGTSDNYVVNHDKSDPVFVHTESYYDNDDKTISIRNTFVSFIEVKCIIGTTRPTYITMPYKSNRSQAEFYTHDFPVVSPYEGAELTFYIFGR